MARFKLIEKKRTKMNATFQVIDERDAICGSICVENREVGDFLRCWSGATDSPPQSSGSFGGGVPKSSKTGIESGDLARLLMSDPGGANGDESTDATGNSGVGAMVFTASWLMRVLNLQVEFFGRPAVSKHFFDCELSMSGRHLLYIIRLDHSWIVLFAQLLDKGDAAEHLVGLSDNGEGWQHLCRLIAAMERSGLRSLTRPFHVGSDSGPNAFQFC